VWLQGKSGAILSADSHSHSPDWLREEGTP
jgi:hypothetical protein